MRTYTDTSSTMTARRSFSAMCPKVQQFVHKVGTYRVGAVVQGGCGRTGWGGDVQGGCGRTGWGGDVQGGFGHTGWGGDKQSAVVQGGVGTYRVRSCRVGWGRTECSHTGWGGDIWGAVYEVGCQVVQHSRMCPKVRI